MSELPSYAVLVHGLKMPKPIGGHPALDFCNTYADWEPPFTAETERNPRGEWLDSYDHLVVWAEFSGLFFGRTAKSLRSRTSPRTAAGVLTEARELRRSLYRVLMAPPDEAAFAEVAHRAEHANSLTRLTINAVGLAEWTLPESDDPRLPLWAIALSAADLLARQERFQVRACPGHECGWLFLDTRGRRRWCNMATCGNRAKVRTHSHRHRNPVT